MPTYITPQIRTCQLSWGSVSEVCPGGDEAAGCDARVRFSATPRSNRSSVNRGRNKNRRPKQCEFSNSPVSLSDEGVFGKRLAITWRMGSREPRSRAEHIDVLDGGRGRKSSPFIPR